MPLSVRSAMLVAEIDTATGAVTGLRHLGRELTLVGGPSSEPPFRLELAGVGAVTDVLATSVERAGDGVRSTWWLANGVTVIGNVQPRGEDLRFEVIAQVEGGATVERLTYPVLASIGRLAGLSNGGDNAAPIRVLAGNRGLDQRRIRDREGNSSRRLLGLRTCHRHRNELACAFAVLDDLLCQFAAKRHERLAELVETRIVAFDDARLPARRSRAGGEQEKRVAGGGIAVDGDGVKRVLGGLREQTV